MLASVGEDLSRDGIELRLARVVGQVRDVLETALTEVPPIYETTNAAVIARST